MLKTGLTSISFRKLDIDTIIEAVKKVQLDAIEWGGDIHVPHGDLKAAESVRSKMDIAGLEVSSYGSYYYAGFSEQNGLIFKDVLASAKALGAPTIRIWAGKKNYEDCTKEEIENVVKDTWTAADMAYEEGIKIAFEFHSSTLTNTNKSTKLFAEEVKHKNVLFYWQPIIRESVEYCSEGLSYLINEDILSNIHVFNWTYEEDKIVRRLLKDGVDRWENYIDILNAKKEDRYLLIEFVKDDSLESFYKDGETLKNLTRCGYNRKRLSGG